MQEGRSEKTSALPWLHSCDCAPLMVHFTMSSRSDPSLASRRNDGHYAHQGLTRLGPELARISAHILTFNRDASIKQSTVARSVN
jgi:hypothetical protein